MNTSISALDKPDLLNNCLTQYRKLKSYCKSILRIVSADFNIENKRGHELAKLQAELFKNSDTLDTVLRVNKNNDLVKSGVINVKQSEFLGKKALISKFNKSTYFGKCSTCHEMCGLNIKLNNREYPEKAGISKQIKIFKR